MQKTSFYLSYFGSVSAILITKRQSGRDARALRLNFRKGEIFTDKKVREIGNVTCDAKNCVYHSQDCKCMAGSIKVGCRDACSCGETNCATFELNKDAVKY